MKELLAIGLLVLFIPTIVLAQADVEEDAPTLSDQNALYISAAALLIGLVVLGYLYHTKKIERNSLAIYGVSLLILVGIGYSLNAYLASSQGCAIPVGDKVALHCHYNLYIEICGDRKELPWEQGTDLHHTHKGSYRIHTHPNPVDRTDLERLTTLGVAMQDLGLNATQTSIEDSETGRIYDATENACNDGTDDTLRVSVIHEGAERGVDIMEDWLNYSYEDEDDIFIRYG